MRAALRIEWWKLRRSRVVVVATGLMGLLLPVIGLAFYSVATTGGTGAVAGKASALLVGQGWMGYLGLVGQVAAVAVFMGAGVVVAWMFGREFADRTFPSLLALPVTRGKVAAAKFIVLTEWMLGLAVVVGAVALGLGLVGRVGPVDGSVLAGGFLRLFGITIGAGILSLTMGFVASIGRGYLAAIGAIVVIIAVSQVAVLFGTGGWFPFAVPGLLAVAGTEGAPTLNQVQLALVPTVSALGAWLTIAWWRTAEVV